MLDINELELAAIDDEFRSADMVLIAAPVEVAREDEQEAGAGPVDAADNAAGDEPPRKRKRGLKYKKTLAVERAECMLWYKDNPQASAEELKTEREGVTASGRSLRRWRKEAREKTRAEIMEGVKRMEEGSYRLRARDAKYPELEARLEEEREERAGLGLDRSEAWYTARAKELFKELYPQSVDPFKASRGWVWRVRLRHDLKAQRVTTTNAMSVEVFKERRAAWLADERDWLREHRASLCMGLRLNGDRIFNADEVGLCLDAHRRQICRDGEIVVRMRPPALTVDVEAKRFATLVPVMSFSRIVFMLVILKGGAISAADKAHYARYGQIAVVHNKKAWMSKEAWKTLGTLLGRKTRAGFLSARHDPTVLYCDNLSTHKTAEALAHFRRKNIESRMFIAKATAYQQPVDQCVGATIKLGIKREYVAWRTRREEELIAKMKRRDAEFADIAAKNKTNLKELRRLTVTWCAKTIKRVNDAEARTDEGLLRKSWRNSGLTLKLDGSEDDELRGVWINNKFV